MSQICFIIYNFDEYLQFLTNCLVLNLTLRLNCLSLAFVINTTRNRFNQILIQGGGGTLRHLWSCYNKYFIKFFQLMLPFQYYTHYRTLITQLPIDNAGNVHHQFPLDGISQ